MGKYNITIFLGFSISKKRWPPNCIIYVNKHCSECAVKKSYRHTSKTMLIKAVHAMTRIIHKNWNSHLDNCLRDFWRLFGRWRFLWVILFNQRGHVWA